MPSQTCQTYPDIERVSRAFAIQGDFVEGRRFGNGLINDTYAATFKSSEGELRRFIFQRINHRVFRQPLNLMDNVERVCSHIRQRLQSEERPSPERCSLTLVMTREERCFHHHVATAAHGEESYWRCFHFIDGCTSFDVVETPGQAYQAARKFGEFQRLVSNMEGNRLAETIPDFHHTPKRFEALRNAIAADPLGRAGDCRGEIDFALSREPVAHHLLDLHTQGLIPERVTHNDTKLSNVLIDDLTGEGICVVDLDTVMPGLSLYDFGDLVRTCVSPIEEDSTDLDAIEVRIPIFEALARGFLEEMAGVLTPCETANLAFSGKLLTYEVGLRFLTDHLLGDPYFGTKRPNHNLERARNQFQLVRQIEESEPAMNAYVDHLLGQSATSDHRLLAV